MAEYIDRQAAIEAIDESLKRIFVLPVGKSIMDKIPTADVQPVVHSFWGYNPGDNIPYCDNCGMPQDMPSDFCHACGADMREKADG